MSTDRLPILGAYADTRWAQATLRTRADIERRQVRLWRRHASTIARTPAIRHLAGQPLAGFPVVTPADIRANFSQWNTLGLDTAAARTAAEAAERGEPGEIAPGVTAGFSTGTSGSRGVFLTTPTERARYIGQSLAKLLPGDALLRRWRIALCLRANSALYRDVSKAGPFDFRFIGLDTPAPQRARTLSDFAPNILIAPSHVLAALACDAQSGALRPPPLQRLFYGADPMGEAERNWIAATLGARPDPIYQATEGFLGAACTAGVLHLNEDSFVIEQTPVPGTNRFTPIITDLRRTSQPMIRVQLDDLLEPLDAPCPCGSPLLAVRGVEGRLGDLWRWGDVVITPRDVETAIVAAIGPKDDWQAVASPTGIDLQAAPEPGSRAREALATLLARRAVSPPVTLSPLESMQGFKRRRVRWIDG